MTDHHDHGHAAPDMAHDMLRRFVGAAIVTVPIVLYSPLGTSLVGHELAPPFGLSRGLLGFVLTSVVVWWGGWPFVSSAWRSLLRGELTMMTLIAIGILVSYGYSVAVTFGLPGELFYDAAAMLTAFSLLGHWLEMRSRFATGRAVEALLELAPPTARAPWTNRCSPGSRSPWRSSRASPSRAAPGTSKAPSGSARRRWARTRCSRRSWRWCARRSRPRLRRSGSPMSPASI